MSQELHDKLAALRAELTEIDANLAKVPEWEARRKSLCGGWYGWGKIKEAKIAIRDAAFPVFTEAGPNIWDRATRVVAVDDKWIELREDGRETGTKYRRSDGMEGQRRKRGSTIDVEKALRIWAEHQAARTAQPEPAAAS